MRPPQALIFDFYGVLYDDLDWDAIDERVYAEPQKRRLARRAFKEANLGLIGESRLRRTIAELAEDGKHPGRPAVKPAAALNLCLLGLIENLKSRCRIGLLSNGTRRHIEEVFKSVGGAEKFFDALQTSDESLAPKPSPRAFKSVLKKLGAKKSRTLFIDDSPTHIEGAKRFGLMTHRFTDMDGLRRRLKEEGLIADA